MTELAELLAAIHADPDDVAPRLVYADLLLERGDPLGELIQIDCARNALPVYDPARLELGIRRTQIFDEHLRDGWLGWFGVEKCFPRFTSGFIETIHFNNEVAEFDIDELDDELARMYESWVERECRCGAHHDPLMWITPDGKFPLVRRFGGIRFAMLERYIESFAERGVVELRTSGDGGDWHWITRMATLQTIVMTRVSTVAHFERVLAMPKLAELAFDKSPAVAKRFAQLAIPPTLRRISIAPSEAEPIREALARSGRRWVENRRPEGDEIVLTTNVMRFQDLAFVDRPIIADDALVHTPLDPAHRTELELPGDNPSPEWPRRGVIDVRLGDPAVSIAPGSLPRNLDDGGVAVGGKGQICVRLENLVAHRPVMIVWRLVTTARLHVYMDCNAMYVEPPAAAQPGSDWVFVIPASIVRAPFLVMIAGSLTERPVIYHELRYYQPDA